YPRLGPLDERVDELLTGAIPPEDVRLEVDVAASAGDGLEPGGEVLRTVAGQLDLVPPARRCPRRAGQRPVGPVPPPVVSGRVSVRLRHATSVPLHVITDRGASTRVRAGNAEGEHARPPRLRARTPRTRGRLVERHRRAARQGSRAQGRASDRAQSP